MLQNKTEQVRILEAKNTALSNLAAVARKKREEIEHEIKDYVAQADLM